MRETKRSVTIRGRRTSISLADPWWIGLKEIADELDLSREELIGLIDRNRLGGEHMPKLSNAIRLFIFEDVKTRATGLAERVKPASHAETLQ